MPFFGGAGHLGDQIFHAPGAKFWHYAAELHTISVTYPLCGSALNLPEMCPLKLTDFCLFLYHQSYTILPATPRWERQSSNYKATPTCLIITI